MTDQSTVPPAGPSRPVGAEASREPDLTGMPPRLRRAIDRFWHLRGRAQRTAVGRLLWKGAVSVLGFVIIVVGIILLPLPGPGWLIIFAGLGIWATEFEWAGRLLAWTKVKVRLVTGWILRWPRWVKGASIGLCLAALYPLYLGYRVIRDWM
jgi:uncharacterized protein (TIGR02611 family)